MKATKSKDILDAELTQVSNGRLLFCNLENSFNSWQGKINLVYNFIQTSSSLECENNSIYFYFNNTGEKEDIVDLKAIVGVEVIGNDSRFNNVETNCELIDIFESEAFCHSPPKDKFFSWHDLFNEEAKLRFDYGSKGRQFSSVWRLQIENGSMNNAESIGCNSIDFFDKSPFLD